ncbi:Murein DD-endopeptidase MepM and murein hydrolase activator NlpD, contain LysM domain [Flaviramulus basaltis]|uniref:Murein DD-endopeptidase MepM and murein hydrolase activator NlpD, contain LysM domain n=1 Tax=Flaviramulus basaltis TaxID=369401 RepID=A0A1K2IRP5_9FLAO|nr:M23 family metallopeptidase [Flaviramulus basaltis]SFZ94864.1 Murein DD-endopeptidase MepM and murein hydrolase activator NlpD, contain LysM domain [Flaviramulus basaltis]
MNFFELPNIFQKINLRTVNKLFGLLRKKELRYVIFTVLIIGVYFSDGFFSLSHKKIEKKATTMNFYNESLKINVENPVLDSVVNDKEREQLLYAIENRIVQFLYEIPDYSLMPSLETYLRYSPRLLDEIPSCVPLEKGNYDLRSQFGYRIHPISGGKKKHFGLDFAAPKNKHVFATASGTVVSISHSEVGYGTHIIIKHRFGFQTLYGHLTKVLVSKGQFVKQHELIGTVGASGASTGNHLHYEVIKNGVKVDPIPSLNLKKNILKKLIN